eukprot:8825553-Pyramimonas_sp.AAC.1
MVSGNISAIAHAMNVSRQSLPKQLRLIASALVHVDRALRGKVEAVCIRIPRVTKHLFVDCVAYDETPMPIVVPGSLDMSQRQQLALECGGDLGHAVSKFPQFPQVAGIATEKSHATSKLLQSEQRFG